MTNREICTAILDKLATLESDLLCLASSAGSASADSNDPDTSNALRVFEICAETLSNNVKEIRDDVYRSFYL